jgi:hypothetical protein
MINALVLLCVLWYLVWSTYIRPRRIERTQRFLIQTALESMSMQPEEPRRDQDRPDL